MASAPPPLTGPARVSTPPVARTLGNTGTGTFNQTMAGATNSVTKLNLIVGNGAGGDGTYNLRDGNLTIGVGNLTIGAQKNSTGFFNYNTTSYNSTAGNAVLNLKQGSLTVGDLGTGAFAMGGGTLSTGLTLGSQVGGQGRFTLLGGGCRS